MKHRKRLFLFLLTATVAAAGTVAEAKDVGRFAVVQGEVTTLKPEAVSPIPAAPGAVIVLEEEEATGAASAAKMTFGDWGVVSIGQRTRFRVSEEVVAEATGRSVSKIGMLAGKLRIFVSRFAGGRPEVQVETPTAVVGIKGSEVGVELLEDGSTVITVLSGSATIKLKKGSGQTRTLGPTESWTIPPRGDPPASPATVDEETMERLRGQTEPDPEAPPAPPDDPPASEPPVPPSGVGGDSITNTLAVSSSGNLFSRPSSSALPQPVVPKGQVAPQSLNVALILPPPPPPPSGP